jgi:hypothetical protein
LLADISAEEGLVQIGYDRAKFGALSRLAQFSKMFIFYAASAVFSCPLAMADGAGGDYFIIFIFIFLFFYFVFFIIFLFLIIIHLFV